MTYIARIEREFKAFVDLFRRNRLLAIAVGIIAAGYGLYLAGLLPGGNSSHDPGARHLGTLEHRLERVERQPSSRADEYRKQPEARLVPKMTKDGEPHEPQVLSGDH